MFDSVVASTVGTSGAGAVEAWSRTESTACARKVAAMAGMLETAYSASGSESRDLWCVDNFDAVAAHIGAALRITTGAASNQLLIAVALHERFPLVAAVFAEGLITYQLVRAVVQRGALVVDPSALHELDRLLAEALSSRESLSVAALEKTVDAFVAHVDPQAVIRTETRARGRSVEVGDEDGSGMATVFATLFAHDAKAVDARMDALARTVCPADPRTLDQRRADAMGAWAHGADRLACLCQTEDCPAGENPPSTGVVVYVIASADTIAKPETPAPLPPEPEPTEPEPADAADATDVNDAVAQDEADPADPAIPLTFNEAAPQPGSSILPTPADERTALDGGAPTMFAKPLRELTLTEALTPAPGRLASLRPATMMGGQFLPGAIACRATVGATITRIVHPGQAPPEPRNRPSKKLADFVRCRDLTCRFPGCRAPATNCDVDHTIPWPCGPTAASNLKCLCRRHHLLKTFWGGESGWRDEQLDDGTVIWTAPDGRQYVTTPGSRQLFPELSEPTATVVATGVPATHMSGLTMPRRKTTRAQDRAARVQRERAPD
ncbi:HNH endonuclease [Mycolicibacterium sp. P1-18]|uniref:HNH endonuclease signature motif containing protein n=1 Tax=Mycolicibacterium sp. P1-18 TaxID=2024615 RepID=UPI0011F37CEF|nr:HNH endonuclease signature motif containing protein [Mycolicibacterium sp. P1-18]KAA0092307.1 HNH endonuclease [Mycolicibacterium sp. P1-18]